MGKLGKLDKLGNLGKLGKFHKLGKLSKLGKFGKLSKLGKLGKFFEDALCSFPFLFFQISEAQRAAADPPPPGGPGSALGFLFHIIFPTSLSNLFLIHFGVTFEAPNRLKCP